MSETGDEDLVQRIREIVVAVARVPEKGLGPDTCLFETGVLDSMRALRVVGDIERRFDLVIPQEEIETWVTLRAIADGVARLRAALPEALKESPGGKNSPPGAGPASREAEGPKPPRGARSSGMDGAQAP